MIATKKQLTQLSYEITASAIKVHKELGPGLLESIYETCMVYELKRSGFKVMQQKEVPVLYDGIDMNMHLRLDLLVNDLVIVEIKAVDQIHPVHEAQLLTYMKLLQKPQGLLINFFTTNITKSMKPMVNELFRALPDE
jgi:GxxExxY protein